MADEQHEIRAVNWSEVFSFAHIFKSFRMAIHPSKLALALTAIVAICILGMVLDSIWCVGGGYAQTGEINNHFEMSNTAFDKSKAQWKESRPAKVAALYNGSVRTIDRYWAELGGKITPGGEFSKAFIAELDEIKKEDRHADLSYDKILESSKKDWSEVLDDAGKIFNKEIKTIDEMIEASSDEANETAKHADDEAKAKEQLENDRQQANIALTGIKVDFERDKLVIQGQGIFSSFMNYESKCVRRAVDAVVGGKIFSGMSQYRRIMESKSVTPASVVTEPFKAPAPANEAPGFIYYTLMAANGFAWLITEHYVYAAIFLIVGLAIVSLFGGAIYRIAALHAAREEKISIMQALSFSLSKFFSFYTAPLIPIAIILFIGLLLIIGGLIINLPYVGEIVGGVLFFLALIGGLVAVFLLIGLVTGVGLMYPTIAVEGSDSFDAISRSFSYIFSKPWRAAMYGLVALVYGSITYLFVRFFAYLALTITHFFVKIGVGVGGDKLGEGADKLDVMWTAPQLDRLFGQFSWEAMSGGESIGAVLIGIWVFLVAALVAAYLVSYLSSSLTVVYYLLRQKVDATDLDDVYVEETEEEIEEEIEETQGEQEQPAES